MSNGRWRLVPALATALLMAGACAEEEAVSTIVASGHVEATEVRVSTEVGGRLDWFPLQEGDRVEAGQEIARVDTEDLELQLRVVEAERDLATADLRLRHAGYRAEEIEEADARMQQARAELEAAIREFRRFDRLWELGSGTEKARDDAAARRDVSSRALEAAEATLRKLRAGFRPEEIDQARAHLQASEARIAQLEEQIGDGSIVSSAAGVVTAKLVEPGELLAAGTPLVVVTAIRDAWLTAYLSEVDLARVRLGQTAEVVTDDGQIREGELYFIDSQAEFTPKNVQTRDERVKLVYRIKVRLDNEDGMYKPGMPAEAHFEPVDGGTGEEAA